MNKTVDPRTISDVNVRPELLGLEPLLSPFIQNITSQRADMFASNISQAVVLNGNESPRISSGYEQMFGDYIFDKTKRKFDGQLLTVVPRFEMGLGGTKIKNSPSKTVIYVTNEEGIDYIDIDDYVSLYDGFGYKNVITPNTMFLNAESGALIDKDTEFAHSPNMKDGLYCLGTNANTVYLTIPQVVQDAVVISESFARKCDHEAIHTVKIVLEEDEVPINIYGTMAEPKIFPDIGERVNSDGILMAIRRKNPSAFTDLLEHSLEKVQFSTDKIINVPKGSVVLDVQSYCFHSAYKKLIDKPGIMTQILKYQTQHYIYYKKIIAIYHKYKQMGYTFSPRFSDLVTRCMFLKKPTGSDKKAKLVDRRIPVKYFIINITYGYTRKVSKGFKFAGRSGDKGVVSDIWPDENMPVDEQGIRADIIISPESVENRLNPSQLYEQFYNRLCTLITNRLRNGELGDDNTSYTYILNLLYDIRKEYGRQIEESITTEEQQTQLLNDIRNEGIYLIIPPFCKDITEEKILYLANKYNYVESPVTFKYVLPNGEYKTIVTKDAACIGSKYMYLLAKIPIMQTAAMELTYINQFGLPVKAKSEDLKMQHITSTTPIRFGEDEVSILIMGADPETVSRFLGVRCNCKVATDMLIEKLLTSKHPTDINRIPMSTKNMLDNNINIMIFNHFMGVCGLDTSKNSIGRK